MALQNRWCSYVDCHWGLGPLMFFCGQRFPGYQELVSPGRLGWISLCALYEDIPSALGGRFFCVFLVGPIFTSLPLVEYLSHIDTIKFLLENTTLIIKGVFTTLPGVFEEIG